MRSSPFKATLLAWAWLLCAAAEPGTATLETDRTLEDLAQELYGDRSAADEIRAINGFAPGFEPPPGIPFRLPGNDRQGAISALAAAAQAVQDAQNQGVGDLAPARLERAVASLSEARAACRLANYGACQTEADETWALARLARQESQEKQKNGQNGKQRFAVSVDRAGETRIEVLEGDPVEVSANNKSTFVRPNQAARVPVGSAPEQARTLLPPPEAVLPFPDSRLVTAAIQFHWKAVEGALRYVLLISRKPDGQEPVRQITIDGTSYLFQSKLEDGTYYFFLRTVDASGLVGRASAGRRFQMNAGHGESVQVESPGKEH